MNEQMQKNISALVDDELKLSELQHLTQELANSEELRRLWGHYQVIGDVIRGERIDPGSLAIVDRVRDRLVDEPSIVAPVLRSEIFVPWWRPVAGLAVAASVAGAVVLLTPQLPDRTVPLPVAAVVKTSNATAANAYPLHSGTRWDLGKPAVESKLNTYLVNHQRHAPAANMQGMLEYASFVGYDSGQ